MLLIVLIVLLLLALGGGFYGQHPSREWGPYGWSPFGLILLLVFLLWATGNLHVQGCAPVRIG